VHGGNLAAARLAYPDAPEPWLDLSTGINPVAYPVPSVSAASWARLPEENAVRGLERIAASAYGARAGVEMVAAPGTQALIELLPRLFPAKRVGILGFTYAEHALCWRKAGAVVATVEDGAALEAFDVAVIVNPNNPDGRMIAPDALQALAQVLHAKGGRLIVDEAFVDVLPEGASLSASLPDEGVIVLRSFGKTYGLAGLRLGFALAGASDAARIRSALGPWAVSGPAIEIGGYALSDRAWLAATRVRLAADIARLDAMLTLRGFQVLGGNPLFRLVARSDAGLAFQRLGQAGVLVRAFRDRPEWLRFGLPGSEAEWLLLEERLAKV